MSIDKSVKQISDYLKVILDEVKQIKDIVKKLETKLEAETKAIRKELVSKNKDD